MKIKKEKYWAIIITLLFHVVLLWLLFFAEINKFKKEEKAYVLQLEREVTLQDQKEKQLAVEQFAQQQVKELLVSNKASKQLLQGEDLLTTNMIEDSEQLLEEFEQRQQRIEQLKAAERKAKITIEKPDTINKNDKEESLKERQTVFYVGKSRVEYFLAERYRVKLPIPVYQCEGAGTVEIAISVNRNGMVVNADVIKERSRSASDCMQEAALNAAKASAFSVKQEALILQKGRIVYQFVAQ